MLLKVPESAKEAIAQAIEASKKGQEEAVKQLAELKGEIAALKKEMAELKKEKEKKEAAPRVDEVEKLKREVNELKQRQSVPVTKSSPKPKKPEPPVINIAPEQKPEAQTKTTTLPNGAVVELDAKGDVVRTIKEAPAKTAEDIVGDLSSQIDILKKQNAEAERQRAAQQKILEEQQKTLEQINEKTPVTPTPTLQMTGGGAIPLGRNGIGKIIWQTTHVSSCKASGDWSGEKEKAGEYAPSYMNVGNCTYNLTCIGNNGENISKSINVNVFNTKPQIIFYFNDVISNTFFGRIGEIVKLRWETSNTGGTASCTASNSWSGSKYVGGSQDILLETAGEFSYALTCVNRISGESGTNTAKVTVI